MPGHSTRDFDLLPTDSIKRHLAAIVAADVVGYSRLMGVNEKGTLLGLRRHRAELIDALIAAYKGTIVKTTGDGLLLTFPSIVEAVSCAVAWQHGMAKRNQDISLDRRIEFRIGVNIGDVIVEKGDVFGDGVNIAARLEQIAPAGGICLSEDAYRQVRGKIEIPIADAGEQSLKNIANPIRVYRIEGIDRGHIRCTAAARREPTLVGEGNRRGSNLRGNRPRRDPVADIAPGSHPRRAKHRPIEAGRRQCHAGHCRAAVRQPNRR